jgi:hypothetical protein
MKSVALLSGLLLCFLFQTKAQQVNYFENSSYWRMQATCPYGFPCVLINSYGNYISGDTLVGDVTYKKVLTYSQTTFQWQSSEPENPSCFGADTSLNFNCLIRQEGKKVYVKYPSSDEALMYDFDLALNDTLPSTSVHPQTDLVVTGVDSTLVNGEFRKTFQIEGSAVFTLIEGIGTNFGLLESVFPMLECSYSFLCYWENGIPVYENNDFQVCDQVLNNQDLQSSKIELFPNPTNQIVTINGAKSVLAVYDMSGRKMDVLSTVNSSDGSLILDASAFHSGLYMIILTTQNGKMASTKMIRR